VNRSNSIEAIILLAAPNGDQRVRPKELNIGAGVSLPQIFSVPADGLRRPVFFALATPDT
jgi:hypothetical protein